MLLARRADRQRVVDELDGALREQHRIIDAEDHSTCVVANMDFHLALVEACGNSLMIDSIRNVSSHAMRIGHSINESVRIRMEQALVEHRMTVDAIRSGDPDTAFRHVESHLVVTTAWCRQ